MAAAVGVFWIAVIERGEKKRLERGAQRASAIAAGAVLYQALATYTGIRPHADYPLRKDPRGQPWVQSCVRQMFNIDTTVLSPSALVSIGTDNLQVIALAESSIRFAQRAIHEAVQYPRPGVDVDDIVFREVASGIDIVERAATVVWYLTNPDVTPFWEQERNEAGKKP